MSVNPAAMWRARGLLQRCGIIAYAEQSRTFSGGRRGSPFGGGRGGGSSSSRGGGGGRPWQQRDANDDRGRGDRRGGGRGGRGGSRGKYPPVPRDDDEWSGNASSKGAQDSDDFFVADDEYTPNFQSSDSSGRGRSRGWEGTNDRGGGRRFRGSGGRGGAGEWRGGGNGTRGRNDRNNERSERGGGWAGNTDRGEWVTGERNTFEGDSGDEWVGGDGNGESRWKGRGSTGAGQYRRDQGSVAPSLKDRLIGDVVYGVSPVLAALQAGRRKVHALYVQESADASKRKDKSALLAASTLAKDLGATVYSTSKHEMNMVSDNKPHQGLVLDASELDFETMETMPRVEDVWEEGSGVAPPVWLCLDEVMDPQNFGAALRSAFFLGASGVITCRRNSSPLSAAVSKASAGAMEIMAVHACRSLPQTLADARQRGWCVIGAAAEPDAVSCYDYRPSKPTILVMGNEGYGVRPTVRRLCDAMLRIDSGPDAGSVYGMGGIGLGVGGGAKQAKHVVDSLNVSVATGILLHQLLKARSQGV